MIGMIVDFMFIWMNGIVIVLFGNGVCDVEFGKCFSDGSVDMGINFDCFDV